MRRRVPSERGALLALVLVLGASAALLAFAHERGPVEPAGLALSAPANVVALDRSAQALGESESARTAVRVTPARAVGSGLELEVASHATKTSGGRGPRTEAEYLVELRALARSDPGAFGRRAEAILAGSGPACEQFASVRAAYEERWPGTEDLCARTVSTLSRESESVPQAVVHWLDQRAALESRAREALAAIVWRDTAGTAPVFRIRALRALVLASPEADVPLLARRIHAEGDPDVHSAGRAALEERARPAPTPQSSQEFP